MCWPSMKILLFQNFIESCYMRLEEVFSPEDEKKESGPEGCEIEVGRVLVDQTGQVFISAQLD